ncbi:MAG: GH3 auxin-responsive promoter family protein [Parafilimonas sp.]
MAIFDINFPQTVLKTFGLPQKDNRRQQLRVLKKLLGRSRFTEFGQKFRFDEILMSRHPGKKFQELVPIYNYSTLYKEWWHKTLEGKPDVCWPGKIKYYALSSGTSEAASKFIPVTNDLLKGNRVVMMKQLLTLRNYNNIPLSAASKGWLTLGGSTALQKGVGYYAGDLSGITMKNVPFWFQPFYKPGKKIGKEKDWNKKLEEIVAKAPEWDISFIIGVPAWVQMCLEMIIEQYNLNTIHDIWPNLTLFVHGGVSLKPYKKRFEKLLGKPLTYIETYLASEGFIAYQDRQNARGLKLVTNEHIFLEFVPFNRSNFDVNGDMVSNPQVLMIHEIEEGKEYALLISTSGGAWRYLIGDTIRFIDKEKAEIIITGRTKHFLNVAGEHLSVENMNKAIQLAGQQLNISIPEFTVSAIPCDNFFAHHWYVACNDHVNTETLKTSIDEHLKEINDDYAVERKAALKNIFLDVLPEQQFMQFMKTINKFGGQHKFPRVLKGKMLEDWNKFLKGELVR